jgi:pentatricopeptide repeat protein
MIEAFLRNDYLFTAYEIFKEMKTRIDKFEDPEKTLILFQSFFKFKK